MQVDKMFSAEAAITIGQTKHKRREGYPYNERVIVHCLIMAHWQRPLINIFSKAALGMDGQRDQEKEKLRTCIWGKEKKDEYLKLLTRPRTIYFTKIIKNKLQKHC